jgi:hypothetical protein
VRYNIYAIIGGWLTALFSMVVLSAIFRGSLPSVTGGTLTELSGSEYIGLVIIAFVGYLIGGYVAGYWSKLSSTLHGLSTVVFGVLFGMLVGIISSAITDPSLAWTQIVPAARTGVPFPGILADVGLILLAVSLLAGLIGGYLGGVSVPATEREELERREREMRPPKAA